MRKLSLTKATAIRAFGYRLTAYTLGAIYRVHPQTISNVRTYRTWRE